MTPAKSNFYEGTLKIKPGFFFKDKIFVCLLYFDAGIYWIKHKKAPKDPKTGKIKEQIDPRLQSQ